MRLVFATETFTSEKSTAMRRLDLSRNDERAKVSGGREGSLLSYLEIEFNKIRFKTE